MKNLRKSVFLAYLLIFFQISCKKDIVQPQAGAPIIITSQVTSIVSTSAVSGGNITFDGGAAVLARGVAYGSAQNPTTTNSTTSNGTGTGVFTSTLTGLNVSTQYYVRAYATNSVGTAYGSQLSFRTLAGGPPCPGIPIVTDVDNNTYNTVQIGTQCWTQSNLKVSKYRNGDNIPTGLSDSAWFTTTSGAYAIYDNDPVNESLFGKLYNHCAVMDNRGLCPTGWHVPSSVEWTTLFNNLGGIGIAGGALKSTATLPTPGGWLYPNSHATNSSGFNALPGGYRFEGGDFMGMSLYGKWWSTSFPAGSPPSTCGQPWAIARNTEMNGANTVVYQQHAVRTNGFSVRCLKD